MSLKTMSAVLFMFFATFASTIALGDVAERETDGKVGISEYLILQGSAGMVHALVSTCPMPILRPTGPVTHLAVTASNPAEHCLVEIVRPKGSTSSGQRV
jgi:hypothetical protein